jgi:hypothetical protein
MGTPPRLAFATALACLAIGVPFAADADVAGGALFVTTLPTGADVWVDGTYVGRSPVLVDGLTRGHHAATLTKTGWIVQEVDVDVSAGSTTMTSLRLRAAAKQASGSKALGSVAFRGLAPGAKVTIDGDAGTRDPRVASPIAAGMHVATITTPAGKIARSFTVYAGTETEVMLEPTAAEATRSAIVAPAQEFLPDDAYRVDGKRVVVRYEGHEVVGKLGELPIRFDGVTISYDAAPSLIGGRLYLPFALLSKLTDVKAK